MKRIIIFTMLSFFTMSVMGSLSFAKEQGLTIFSITASSSQYLPNTNPPQLNPYTVPAKAIDNREDTFWMGQTGGAPWWIMIDTGAVNYIERLRLRWHTLAGYIPKKYDIQISNDSSDSSLWTNVYVDIAAQTIEKREIQRTARYVRLFIKEMPYSNTYPCLAEIQAFTYANIPRIISFKGNLKDINGMPINGTRQMIFKIYDRATLGTPLWQETQSNVNIEDGIFSAELGSVNPIKLPFDKQYYLGVKVGTDNEMTPRFKLTTVPYAFRSEQ